MLGFRKPLHPQTGPTPCKRVVLNGEDKEPAAGQAPLGKLTQGTKNTGRPLLLLAAQGEHEVT